MTDEVKVVTSFCNEFIEQHEEYTLAYPRKNMNIAKRIINLQDEGFRNALIQLGWTPPSVPAESNPKRDLSESLRVQKEIMFRNADLMQKIYPDGNHIELRGAAKITQDWIDAIESEIKRGE